MPANCNGTKGQRRRPATLRGRFGYAPGDWLFYATGGFAWTYNRLTLTNFESGATDMPFLWRLGWTAGLGVEAPVAPQRRRDGEWRVCDGGVVHLPLPMTRTLT